MGDDGKGFHHSKGRCPGLGFSAPDPLGVLRICRGYQGMMGGSLNGFMWI